MGRRQQLCSSCVCVCALCVAAGSQVGFSRARWTEPRIFAVPQTVRPSKRKKETAPH